MRKSLIALASFLFFLLLVRAFSSVQVTLSLNSTLAEWENPINASGYAYLNGNPWQGNISLRVDGKEVCFTQTNSNGFYSCIFSSPAQIGNFQVRAYAIANSSIIGESNTLMLAVKYFYGSTKPTKNVVSMSFPLIIQDLNGKIHRVRAFLRVWG